MKGNGVLKASDPVSSMFADSSSTLTLNAKVIQKEEEKGIKKLKKWKGCKMKTNRIFELLNQIIFHIWNKKSFSVV